LSDAARRLDDERSVEMEDARQLRTIAVLKELIRIVEARREGLTVVDIADRLDRGRATVYRREVSLNALLALLEQKCQRRRE